MRRPSPLPTPAPASDARASSGGQDRPAAGMATALDERPDGAAAAVGTLSDGAAPAVGILSDDAAAADRTASDRTAATDGASEPDAADSGAPIRMRDVWRAARARRKALRAEVRRFTVRQRRRRATWLGLIGAVIVLALGTLGAAYSPLFAVEDIHVVGNAQLDAGDLEAALAGQLGTPLPLVDDSAVKAALVAFPLVESYTLEARPPHELVVRIVERTPIGLITSRAGYTLVDAAGVALSTTSTPPAGEPVITVKGGVRSVAFQTVGLVMRSLPDQIRTQVTAVSASTADDVTLTLGATNTQVVWGGANDSAKKALVLDKTMASLPPDTVAMYDVSSPAAVVVR